MSSITNKKFITKETTRRLVKEVADIFKNPLIDQGIYYIHDDSNMLKGYAMIIGPQDTPYENGFYFFEFDFPSNYPQQPPKVTYHTNDGNTRFHPNLYRTGKVCLSILNTWRGEGWTSCQTIKTVLLTLVSILNENPLLNEPGVRENHPEIDSYNSVILYKNYQIAILGMLNRTYLNNIFNDLFYEFMISHYNNNKNIILEKIKNININKDYYIKFYNIQANINYNELCNAFEEFNLLNDIKQK